MPSDTTVTRITTGSEQTDDGRGGGGPPSGAWEQVHNTSRDSVNSKLSVPYGEDPWKKVRDASLLRRSGSTKYEPRG
jgi:hypothetical protein